MSVSGAIGILHVCILAPGKVCGCDATYAARALVLPHVFMPCHDEPRDVAAIPLVVVSLYDGRTNQDAASLWAVTSLRV